MSFLAYYKCPSRVSQVSQKLNWVTRVLEKSGIFYADSSLRGISMNISWKFELNLTLFMEMGKEYPTSNMTIYGVSPNECPECPKCLISKTECPKIVSRVSQVSYTSKNVIRSFGLKRQNFFLHMPYITTIVFLFCLNFEVEGMITRQIDLFS